MPDKPRLDLTDLSVELVEPATASRVGLNLDGVSTGHGTTETGASAVGPWGILCSCCCCGSC